MEVAKKGSEVCIKVEPIPGDAPKMLGRHFDENDLLVSKVMSILLYVLQIHHTLKSLIEKTLNQMLLRIEIASVIFSCGRYFKI